MAPEPTAGEEVEKDIKKEEVELDDVEEEIDEATWGEVCSSCCSHSPEEWLQIFAAFVGVAFFLYWFLFGLDLLGTGAKVMSGCAAGKIFGSDVNPVAGLMMGILATVLLQSSSTTTSIIVTLVGSAISVEQGIYMVMGANIGTSMTSTIVALGQMGDGDQLERAFAGATVHDMFNFMTVGILFPIELITGYLRRMTGAMVKNASLTDDSDRWEGPVDRYIEPLGARVLKENKDVTFAIAEGEAECGDFYPLNCDPAVDPPTYESCGGEFGLIECDDELGCPAFFNPDASARDDKIAGGVVFVIGILILFFCMAGMIFLLQKMLMQFSTRVLYKATNMNGYVGIMLGCGITMIVQSSSITTSTFTPLVGVGALRLEQMLPITLGANLGTTLTALLSALVSESVDSLQVALAHLFFNITGVFVFYPIPFLRNLPLTAARSLGKATRIWRGFPLLYLAVMFLGIPGFFLGLSSLFTTDTKGLAVIGSFIVIVVSLSFAYFAYWLRYKDGRNKTIAAMQARERRRSTMKELPDTMESLLKRIDALEKKAGVDGEVPDEIPEEEEA